MASETTVDRFGRVVIPRKTRDRFGLQAGSPLEVDEREDGILLRPAGVESPVRAKGRVLVFTGELTGDAQAIVERQREERIRRFLPGTRR
jgi:AbrB family looped-hinge helix DNA binding protein